MDELLVSSVRIGGFNRGVGGFILDSIMDDKRLPIPFLSDIKQLD